MKHPEYAEPVISFAHHRANETSWIEKVIEVEDRERELQRKLDIALCEIHVLKAVEQKRVEVGPCKCMAPKKRKKK